jgi:hypothetical protein
MSLASQPIAIVQMAIAVQSHETKRAGLPPIYERHALTLCFYYSSSQSARRATISVAPPNGQAGETDLDRFGIGHDYVLHGDTTTGTALHPLVGRAAQQT